MSIENLLADLISKIEANTAAIVASNKGRAEILGKIETKTTESKKTDSKKPDVEEVAPKKSESKKSTKKKELTEIDVKDALADTMDLAEEGTPQRKAIKKRVIAILDQFDVETSRDLKPAQYAEFIEALASLKADLLNESAEDDAEDGDDL